ncbi:MAG TPA: membrane protein insertase YidC [Bacteroidales bacterium]|nr:membrane protein insertase YidC [Bacteroidales bacterium]
MDRNSIIGIIVIAGILIVWSTLNKPSKEEIEAARFKRDSLEIVHQQQIIQQEKIETAKIQNIQNNITVEEIVDVNQYKSQFGSFADAAVGKQEFTILENELLRLKIANKGGRVYSVELKDYKTYTKKPLLLFDGDSTVFGLNFFSENKSIITNDLFFEPFEKSSNSVKMRLYAGNDRYIEYVYTLNPESYKVDFDINFVGMNEVVASNLSVIDLKFSMYSPQQEKGMQNENLYTTMGYKFYQDEVKSLSARSKDENKEEINTKLKWISYQQQFFSTILVADTYFSNAVLEFTNLESSVKYLKHFESTIGIPFEYSAKSTIPLSFYFGPNHYTTLKKQKLDFEEIIPLGWAIFGWVNKFAVIPVFNFLDNYIASYGIIILILTILIKLVLFPLTYKSYLSTAKMRVLKPEIDEISKKFPKKEDAIKKQQATMAMYKKVGVNPMGGCIPMAIQMPILFAMFRFFPSSIELRQEAFLWADDLSSYDSIFSWSVDIPLISSIYGNHISLFTILMAVALVFSSKLNTGQMNDTNQQMPGMKFMMTYMMPVMMLVFFNRYAAGLSYYYFLSNVITLGQTVFIRRFVDDEAILKKLHENKKKPVKKSKWQERLEAAAKQRGYNPPKKK